VTARSARTSWITPIVVFTTITNAITAASMTDCDCEDDRCQQQKDHRIPELIADPLDQPNAVLGRNRVGAQLCEPRVSLCRAQTNSRSDLIRRHQQSLAARCAGLHVT
jgi:hypothetical protein